jgi:putative iron-dependent peroxidase
VDTPEPQAILTPLTAAAIFLVLTVDSGAEGPIGELLADVSALTRSVGFRVPEAGLTCVTGIGSELWSRMLGEPRPAQLHPLPEFAGSAHTAPSTPGDLLFHIRAARTDLCFELAQRITDRLRGHASVIDEVHGFRSFDDRDLLGFVDGTENPAGAAATASVLIGDEDPQFAGGSYVIAQKYLHDLSAWDALTVEQQELAVGRTKLSDIELDDDLKPANSHVALNTIVDDDGEQRQIVRLNMPFGRVGAAEFGTYFIGYARTPEVTELMLEHMFIGEPPGNHDRILDFSTAVTGHMFFAPSGEMLDRLADLGGGATDEPSETGPAASADATGDSLGIGSLRDLS